MPDGTPADTPADNECMLRVCEDGAPNIVDNDHEVGLPDPCSHLFCERGVLISYSTHGCDPFRRDECDVDSDCGEGTTCTGAYCDNGHCES